MKCASASCRSPTDSVVSYRRRAYPAAVPRARVCVGVSAAAASLAVGAASPASATKAPHQRFVSRPDLKPTVVEILHHPRRAAPGYIFIAPKKKVVQTGPLILDNRGHVVWFFPLDTHGVTDFRVQRYRGRPVLTWWRARPVERDGKGSYAIFDASYRHVATVEPGNDLVGDIHEFLITPRNTALMTISDFARRGGHRITGGAVQELDIATGRVLFEWHSLDHVAPTESYYRPPRDRSRMFDYFHINSVEVDHDDNFLVSARNTHCVYKISRKTGRILWRLGGKRSDFALGRGARFSWQHDARRRADGTLTLFDNAASPKVRPQSRGIVLRLDMRRMRARLVRSFTHKPPIVAIDQGNMQRLPRGHHLIGWGHEPYFTEYGRRGGVVLDARFARGSDSYRAYRFRWTGRPLIRPAVAVARSRVYVSWNGATDVTHWQLLAGERATRLSPAGIFRKIGFEKVLVPPRGARFVAVRALDRAGRTLRTSRTIPRPRPARHPRG
jgi:Arylsulfotransferase (ASST)